MDKLKPFDWLVLCSAGLMLYLLMTVEAKAYEFLTHGPIRNRTADVTWQASPDCDVDQIRQAAAMLDFYLLTDFAIREVESNAQISITCPSVLNYMERGLAFNTSGTAFVSHTDNLILGSEIVLNRDRLRASTAAHEILHALGLAHSDNPASLLCAPPVGCEGDRLRADDIAGLAALYGVPAQCSPYFDGSVLYFPMIAGFSVTAQAVDPLDLSRGFVVVGAREAPAGDWECSTLLKSGVVTTQVYHNGLIFDIILENYKGIWRLKI